jgi:hypothetical protein
MRAVLALAILSITLGVAIPAEAACHAFSVSVEPSSVNEGGAVTVTVTRDGAAAPSDVRVSTIAESARSPGDYTKLDEQVEFTSETSKSLQISTRNDAVPEGPETFRVHLSDPGGCAPNTNYTLGNDVRVTIRASDPTPFPTAPPPLRTARPAVTTPPAAPATPSPSPSPTASAVETTTPSPSFSPAFGLPEEETGGGLPLWPLFGLVLGALAAAGGAWLLWYRRRVG